MRKPIVGISFKNYINRNASAIQFSKELILHCNAFINVDVFMLPSLGTLDSTASALRGTKIHFGAQNISPFLNGPMTGEYSLESLLDIGGTLAEIGHAERREYFMETDKMINKKIKLALQNKIIPILCIGENESQRLGLKEHLKKQVFQDLDGIFPSPQVEKIIIAYEPIWAIGKLEAASLSHIHKTHQIIREIIKEKFGGDISEKIRIIYGGSVSKKNVGGIISDKNVDGVFVGRFGHDPKNFVEIIKITDTTKAWQCKHGSDI